MVEIQIVYALRGDRPGIVPRSLQHWDLTPAVHRYAPDTALAALLHIEQKLAIRGLDGLVTAALRKLLWLAAVRPHLPDLMRARAGRHKIDPLSVVRPAWLGIGGGVYGQTPGLSSLCPDGVDIAVAMHSGIEGDRFAVG